MSTKKIVKKEKQSVVCQYCNKTLSDKFCLNTHLNDPIKRSKKCLKIRNDINKKNEENMTDLDHYLRQRLAYGDQPCTHTVFGTKPASYYIPENEYVKLLDLVHDHVFIRKQPLTLVERSPEVSLLKVDFDFKFKDENFSSNYDNSKLERKITYETIRSIVSAYNQAISKYLSVESKYLDCLVSLRNGPYHDQQIVEIKDGIHLIYPSLIVDVNSAFLIRQEALITCEPILKSLNCVNTLEQIIDEKIITGNWLLHGCNKSLKDSNISPYLPKHYFNDRLDNCDNLIGDLSDRDLLEMCSLHMHKDVEKCVKLRPEFANIKVDRPIVQPQLKKKIGLKSNNANSNNSNFSDPELLTKLQDLLSIERLTRYTTWIEVGFVLYCIYEDSAIGLEKWKALSQKTIHWDEAECDKLWSRFYKGSYTVGTLRYMAQKDNPEEYQKLSENNEKLFDLANDGSEESMANLFISVYGHKYKFVSKKGSLWFKFKDHRWNDIGDGVKLRETISKFLLKTYHAYFGVLDEKLKKLLIQDPENVQIRPLQKKCLLLTDFIRKLGTLSFAKSILGKCEGKLCDFKFLDKLNTDPYLMCFNNGVYDFKNDTFRNGLPSDYITFCTNHNYIEFNNENPHVVSIMAFIDQITHAQTYPKITPENVVINPLTKESLNICQEQFDDDNLATYLLENLATCLVGGNKNEKLVLYSGAGRNGKTKLMSLIQKAFGDYATTLPVDVILVNKFKNGGESASPFMACLKGIRIAVVSESNKGDRVDSAKIKGMTGGDPQKTRKLYGDPIEFKLQAKLYYLCNNRPVISKDDQAMWDRIENVPFRSRFIRNPDPNKPREYECDNELEEKLELWAEAFMSVLIEYYRSIKEYGCKYYVPALVTAETQNYANSMDSMKDFLLITLELIPPEKKMIIDPDNLVKFTELYKKYQKSIYNDPTVDKNDFKERVQKEFNCTWHQQKKVGGRKYTNVFDKICYIKDIIDVESESNEKTKSEKPTDCVLDN